MEQLQQRMTSLGQDKEGEGQENQAKDSSLNLREVVMIFFMKLENFSSMNSDTELLSRMTKKDFL